MGFFGWMFWCAAVVIIMSMVRRRRRGRRCGGPAPDRDLQEQRSYIEALGSRVGQLEERLDFTERLLAGRGEGSRV